MFLEVRLRTKFTVSGAKYVICILGPKISGHIMQITYLTPKRSKFELNFTFGYIDIFNNYNNI